jgi:hypothetical protein
MMRRVRCALSVVAVLAASLLLGCGASGPKVYPVSGTVTLDGKPLPDGVIYFKTLQTGTLETFPVKDGEFKGQAQEGDRRVEISAYRTTIQGAAGMKGEVKENLIPPRYNVDSTLTAAVTRDGPNTFKFEVASK